MSAPGASTTQSHLPANAKVDRGDTHLTALRRVALSPSLAVALTIGLFVLYGITQTSAFLNGQVWINLIRDASFTAIVACFVAIVMIGGGLDLSVGSVFSAGAMVSAAVAFHGQSALVAFGCGVLVGAGVGLLNGVIINYFSIPAIIVTLGSLFGVSSLVDHFSQAQPIAPLPTSFTDIGQHKLFGLPYIIYIAILVAIIAYLLLHSTALGWNVRALGANREAARSSGIRVRALSISLYVCSGAAAALAGALESARLGAGTPDVGNGLELTVIAAAIIGGTSIAGGLGTIPGAVLGSLLLSVLGTGLILLHVDPTLQELATGVVLIVAAGIDQLRRRQMFRTSARRALAAETP
ncbi:MAG TPA: ABC transporter permease [Gaiellaceae bacterium]|nr:ABC transporter permease [Gaiellaceae bacterium]